MLEVSHVTKKYHKVVANSDITFQIPDGQIGILLGPNGAGKSTTMKMMLGLVKPTDGSVTVLCAKGGVEPQSETVWRQADEYKVPRMIFVNKMDIMGADFYRVLDMIKERLKCNAVPIQLPIGKEETFKGIVDLVDMNARIFYDDLGKDMRTEEIPEDMRDLAAEYRDKLLDAVSEFDDEIADLYLMGEEVPAEKIRAAIRKGTVAGFRRSNTAITEKSLASLRPPMSTATM